MKDLRKAIMKGSSLRKKFLKTKSVTDRKNHNAQQNYCWIEKQIKTLFVNSEKKTLEI